MQQIKNHIIFKSLAICLAMTILVPSAIKLLHTFEHHSHDVVQCLDNKSDAHLHEFHFDCDFYKFQLSNLFTISSPAYDFIKISYRKKITNTQYDFLSDYQRLHFSLRGPPHYS
ncbi:hypothetical protein [Corallibacter sp.]|uniref:hypothetical protein n=1 Tax=Corallibacter sp. TaxID=2038084 RepID=UPI003AB6DBAA